MSVTQDTPELINSMIESADQAGRDALTALGDHSETDLDDNTLAVLSSGMPSQLAEAAKSLVYLAGQLRDLREAMSHPRVEPPKRPVRSGKQPPSARMREVSKWANDPANRTAFENLPRIRIVGSGDE